MSLLRSAHRPYSHLNDEEDRFIYRHRTTQRRKSRLQRALLAAVAVLTVVLVSVVVAAVNISLGTREGTHTLIEGSSQHSSAAFEDALVVRTNCGEYVGTIEDGAFVFKGIPYAKPPVGHLRWKKPVPLWADHEWCNERTRQRAHKYALPCFQLNPSSRKFEGKEDCLYLNVWSPRLDTSAGLEVMVWIHGGFLQFGSGHEPGLCPSGRIAKDLNMVFVSFNYRLHALGFMALDLLVENPGADSLGNYGLWDQIVALQWVKENVRVFGGDPEKVTVFGPDSGAASILAMMTSSAIKDMFHAAWLIGPAVIFNRTFDDLSQHNHAFFLPRSGCSNATCLRKMSPQDVIETYLWKDEPSFRIRDQNDLPIQGIFPEQLIVLDGELLQIPPIESIEEGKAEDIPTLVETRISEMPERYKPLNMTVDWIVPRILGTSAQAINIWPGPDDLSSWKWSQLMKYVVTSLDSFGPGISHLALQEYNSSDYNEFASPEEVYSTMVTDLRQTCSIHDLSKALANNSAMPVFRYVITSRPSKPVRVLDYPASYSFHAWEAVAFFDHMELYFDKPSPEDIMFRNLVQKIIGTFVRSSGHHTGISDWDAYPEEIAIISHNVTVVDSYHRSKCRFWEEQGFTEYAWVS